MNQVPIERRQSPRRRVFKGARLIGHGLSFECVVRNLSAGGAGLEVDRHSAMPAMLTLVFDQGKTVQRAQMRWRRADRMGLAFV